MTTRKVKFKGVDYPIEYNMYAWRTWKQLTGYEMTDISKLLRLNNAPTTQELCDTLALVYSGMLSACKLNGVDFNYDFDTFLMNCDEHEMGNLIESLNNINSVPESAKNTGQPKKATKK